MPIPGLTDTYTFSDWLKADYSKAGRPKMVVTPENGGLLTVEFVTQEAATSSEIAHNSANVPSRYFRLED